MAAIQLEREVVLPMGGELVITTSTSGHPCTHITLIHDVKEEEEEMRMDGEAKHRKPHVQADIFGTEMSVGVPLQLPPARTLTIFTSTGCHLHISAPPAVFQRCYASACSDVWRRSVLDVHAHLEAERVDARGQHGVGPRVLIVSDRHASGASTWILLLMQYAVRLGYHPLLVDAAFQHARFGYPCCISMFQQQYTMDVEEEMNFCPGLHHFMTGTKENNASLFVHVLRQVMSAATEKMARNDRCRVGGLFIDYGVVQPASVLEAEEMELSPDAAAASGARQIIHPLDTLLDTIVESEVDHVFVVQSQWLRFKIAQRAMKRYGRATEAKLLSSPSIISYDNEVAFRLMLIDAIDAIPFFPHAISSQQRWLSYFFGTPTSPVKPTMMRIHTQLVRIATIGSTQLEALTTLMPMMDEEADDAPNHNAHTPAKDPAVVQFLTPQDIAQRGMVVAISTATEFETSTNEDGEVVRQRLPFSDFERNVRMGMIAGFALVEGVEEDRITLVVPGAPLAVDVGVCLLPTKEFVEMGSRTS